MKRCCCRTRRWTTTAVSAQRGGPDSAEQPLGESWPTNGDYSGEAGAAADQPVQRQSLTLAWTRRLTNGTSAPGIPVIEGGIGDITWNGATQIKGRSSRSMASCM